MAHSVSHNLIFELIDDNLIIVTVKKNQFVVDFRFFETLDKDKLETILGELPEIYSEITLLIRNKNFITLPENFYNEDLSEIFKLSYTLFPNETVWLDKSEQNIGIAYAIDKSLIDLIVAKFPRVKIHHEAKVILSKLYKEVNFKQPRILITINTENLIIFAISEGELMLCNSYPVKSNDDIFYFVMLAVEQLHFIPSETELVILGEPPARIEMFELFKNYINEINIWLEEYQTDPQIINTESLAHSFALQTLVCE